MTGKTTLLGFLGISYLTFKAVQVVMDLRDGVMKEYHPFRYIQFLLFSRLFLQDPSIVIGALKRFEKPAECGEIFRTLKGIFIYF